MALMLNEKIEKDFFKVKDTSTNNVDLKESDSFSSFGSNSLMVEIEGIHGYPYATRNFTRYMPSCLESSIHTWTTPYKRPVIKHHNDHDGDIIGRICEAKYKDTDTLSGTPTVLFTVNIPGKEQEDVLNGLLDTVSIGVMVNSVKCSICGKELMDGDFCEHERGQVYDGKTCYWDIYDMEAKELSYVIVPSDKYAKNINMYRYSEKPFNSNESLNKTIDIKEQEIMSSKKENACLKENEQLDIVELKKSIEELEARVNEFKESITLLEQQVETLTKEKEVLINEKETLEKEKAESLAMRDGLEVELAECKEELKLSLIENVNLMRKLLGRNTIKAETLKDRCKESIKDCILDMKEELSNIETIPVKEKVTDIKPNTVIDPTLPKEEVEIKENVNTKKTDLKADLFNIFDSIMSAHK